MEIKKLKKQKNALKMQYYFYKLFLLFGIWNTKSFLPFSVEWQIIESKYHFNKLLINAQIIELISNMDLIKTYDQVLNDLSNLIDSMGLENPIELYAVFYYMLKKGYLSRNHKFKYSDHTIDLSYSDGIDVIAGRGVCRHQSAFLVDLYMTRNIFSYEAGVTLYDNFESKRKKAIIPNHSIAVVEYGEEVFLFDPTNNEFLIPDVNFRLREITDKSNSFSKLAILDFNYDRLKISLSRNVVDFKKYRYYQQRGINSCKANKKNLERFYEEQTNSYQLITTLAKEAAILERKKEYL